MAIFFEAVVSAIISPLRWVANRYPKQILVLVMLATGTLILQVKAAGRIDPRLFTAVLSTVIICTVGMIAAMWLLPIEEETRPPRYQPPQIEDWFSPVTD